MTRQSTISYKQIEKLLSLSTQNIFNSRKRQIPGVLFCFGIDLQFSSPLTPQFWRLNTIYTNCQIADTEVFILQTAYRGSEGGSVFPANDIQDVRLIYYQSFGPLQPSAHV